MNRPMIGLAAGVIMAIATRPAQARQVLFATNENGN
jgi:hypothetical protein